MRLLSILVLLACMMACVVAQPGNAAAAAAATPAAATPAAAAATTVPETAAPATPAPTPAAPAAAAPAASTSSLPSPALEAVQRTVEELAKAQASATSELRAAAQATDSKVAQLSSTLEKGLAKLHEADATQTAHATKAAAAAAATPAAGSSKADEATVAALADTKARLESVERELTALKKMLGDFVAAQTKANAAAAAASAKPAAATADPLLAEIKANQVLMMAQLANATASFDAEAVLSAARTHALAAASNIRLQFKRGVAAVQANGPTLLAQGRELGETLSAQGLEHAALLSVHAQDANVHLSDFLAAKGVPPEMVHYASLSIMGLVALILVLIALTIVKALLRALCCCCCRSNKKKSNNAAAGAAASSSSKKNNKGQ